MESMQVRGDKDHSQLQMNPYSNRGPVTKPSQFYGRHDDIMNIIQSIVLWQPFAVSGESRIGKTSLLYYLVHPDGARKMPAFQRYVKYPSAYIFVLIELQRLPTRDAVGFWRYMLDRLLEEAEKDENSHEIALREYKVTQSQNIDGYQLQTSFESCLKQLEKKVVFFFDDFDVLLENFEESEVVQVTDKLKTLKEALDLNDRLNYIIVSTDPLVRLFKANNIFSISPLISIINSSPPLGLLESDAINALILEPLHDSSIHFTQADIDFIHQLAGRYPGLVKLTCYNLFKAHTQEITDVSSIQQSVEQAMDEDPHVGWLMDRLWERVEKDERSEALPLTDTLVRVAQGQEPTSSAAVRELSQRGLIVRSPSTLHIFGDLFCRVILRKAAPTKSSIELTHLEANLYNYLADHLEKPCSRKELQTAVWGNNIPQSPDALEQLVKRVRNKIEPNRDQPRYLISVRGQGYLLREDPVGGHLL